MVNDNTPNIAGRKPSKALFKDYDEEQGIYSLDNFHDVFIECEDMTEYEPALKLVGSWKEWERLKRDFPGLVVFISEWKDELEVKLRSRAVKKILSLQDGEDQKALAAAKFISENGWDKRAGGGRPSKKLKDKEARELARAAAETKDEEDRMLKLVKGGVK